MVVKNNLLISDMASLESSIEDQSTGMLAPVGKESLLDGSFYSRSSFNQPQFGDLYDKTLFNLCYLV